MSAPEQGVASDEPGATVAPSTGDAAIDEALQGLHDLPSTRLGEHHDRLAQVHEALHAALERSGDEPEST